ncbi:MAG: hypothetical protein ACI4PL_00835 [Faecousia sp.]
MAKNEFDPDFDFEKEYGFDPNEFLDSDLDADIDFSQFDEEQPDAAPGAEAEEDFSDFDLDGLDLDDLNLEDFDLPEDLDLSAENAEDSGEDFGDFSQEVDPEEDIPLQDEGPDVLVPSSGVSREDPDDEEDFDATDFDEEDFEKTVYNQSADASDEESEQRDSDPSEPDAEADSDDPGAEGGRPVRRRPRPEKLAKPKREKKVRTGPTLMSRFLDFYMAPLREAEQPQDPNAPRRRRKKKSKAQIFKEVYLPPILAGVALVLILVFAVGAVSNSIERRKQDKETALRESQAASEQANRLEQEVAQVMEEADRLAQGYDYDGAIAALESYTGEMTQEMQVKKAEYASAKSSLVEWKDYTSIANLSFHVLIADPARAFADKGLGGQYNKNFVTIDEFSKILDQLYAGGYVLVDFDSFTETNTGLDGKANFFTKPIALPEGKKPIMITETMVNYFNYMIDSNDDKEPDAGGAGFAYRLIVDNNGDIKAQMVDSAGQTQTGNYDLVPILEDFIKEHPDFSYQGARAILAVTGSEGIFGYRINTSNISTVSQAYYDEQVAGAKTLVQALRDKGYTLACFTYGNIAYGDKSATQIKADLQDWASQIVPVIGDVDVMVFARTSDIGDYSGAKFGVLSDAGFRYFIKHGSAPAAEVNNSYVRQTRLMVTGENMAWHSDQFSKYFDSAAILNNLRGNVPKS